MEKPTIKERYRGWGVSYTGSAQYLIPYYLCGVPAGSDPEDHRELILSYVGQVNTYRWDNARYNLIRDEKTAKARPEGACPCCSQSAPKQFRMAWAEPWGHRCPHGEPCASSLSRKTVAKLCPKCMSEGNARRFKFLVETPLDRALT